MENIYDVAILAYRAGWCGVLVADGLTSHQLHGNTRVGGASTISAVAVSIHGQADQLGSSLMAFADTEIGSNDDGGVGVYIKRMTGTKEDEPVALLEMLRARGLERETPVAFDAPTYWDVRRFYFETGLWLHDPDRSVFAMDTAKQLGYEDRINTVLAALSPLPAGSVI